MLNTQSNELSFALYTKRDFLLLLIKDIRIE
jgi:hypothetical protein